MLVDIFAQRIEVAALLVGCFDLFDGGLGFYINRVQGRLSGCGGGSVAVMGAVMVVAIGERERRRGGGGGSVRHCGTVGCCEEAFRLRLKGPNRGSNWRQDD